MIIDSLSIKNFNKNVSNKICSGRAKDKKRKLLKKQKSKFWSKKFSRVEIIQEVSIDVLKIRKEK